MMCVKIRLRGDGWPGPGLQPAGDEWRGRGDRPVQRGAPWRQVLPDNDDNDDDDDDDDNDDVRIQTVKYSVAPDTGYVVSMMMMMMMIMLLY